MIVTKVRGQDKVDKILVTPTEAAMVKKLGVPLKLYVERQLRQEAVWKMLAAKAKESRQ